jgi:two-component system, chemotaxis family, sensor kinase CheA
MADKDSPIVKEFLLESCENLSNISDEITQYEKSPDNMELLNSIYRKIHTLKGSASFLSLAKLQEVTHNAETLLDYLREGKFSLNSEIIDVLLNSFDICSEIVGEIEKTGEEGDRDYSDIVNKLVGTLEKSLLTHEVNRNELHSITGEVLSSEAPSSSAPTTTAAPISDPAPASAPAKSESKVIGADSEPVPVPDPRPIEKVPEVQASAPAPAPAPEKKASPAKKSPAPAPADTKGGGSRLQDSIIRVNVNLLDKIMNVVGELVLNRNQIVQCAAGYDLADLNRLAAQLNVITSELQNDVMATRMQPIGSVINKFERIVRDLARSQKKKIGLVISGKDTELDKTLLDAIKDPLTHLVRNSVDHGVEFPEDRVESGKSDEGTIHIKAYHEGGQVNIEIVDDGKGIDPAIIKDKAISKKLVTPEEAENMSDKQIINLIFAPGFSTAEQVTNISGRGVGMDVVKTNIEKIGGSVDVTSRKGEGSSFKLKIPLTLAIVPALIVHTSDDRFAIPQANLVELVRLDDDSTVEQIHGAEVFRLRGDLIPVFRLSRALGTESKDDKIPDSINIVVLNAEGQQYGLIVDSVQDTEEIVVKPLSNKLKNLKVFSGSTIMGDGRVSLIVDVLGLYSSAVEGPGVKKNDLRVDETDGMTNNFLDTQEVVLCKLDDDRIYGIPLFLVSRLEEFRLKDVEWSGDQPLIRYRDNPMPLIDIQDELRIHDSTLLNKSKSKENKDTEDRALSCVVISIKGVNVGLVVEKIHDIAVTDAKISADAIDRKEFIGTMFINDKTVTIIDVHELVVSSLANMFEKDKNQILKSGKILLVEDSPLYRRIQSELLAEHGYDVEICNDGVEATELLDSGADYNLIITDLEMPRMGGFELAEYIRHSGKSFSDIPIIAISSKDLERIVSKGDNVNIDKYVQKQNREDIIDIVNYYLDQKNEGLKNGTA